MERAARREQVLGCAERVFGQRGYHAATVSDIIEEAGVARGTFYLYFKSKRAVFDELLDRFVSLLTAQITRVELTDDAGPPVDQVLGNVERILGLLFERRDMTRILLREAVGLDSEFDRKLDEFYGRVIGIIEGSLTLGQEMGLVRRCDVRVAALSILGTVKEVASQALVSPDSLPQEQALAREILETVLGGILAPSLRTTLESAS